jgi:uncharacterized protein YjbI with pentapeptide repeats
VGDVLGAAEGHPRRCPECGGAPTPPSAYCLMHAGENLYELVSHNPRTIDLRGCPLDQASVDRILQALKTLTEEAQTQIQLLDCRGARPVEALTFAHLLIGTGDFAQMASDHAVTFRGVTVGERLRLACEVAALGVAVAAGGDVLLDGLKADRVRIEVSGVGGRFTASGARVSELVVEGHGVTPWQLDLSGLTATDVRLDALGGMAVTLDGTRARRLTLDRCDATGLRADRLRGDAQVQARECSFSEVSLTGAEVDLLDLTGCEVTGLLGGSDARAKRVVLEGSAIGSCTLSQLVVTGPVSLRDTTFEGVLELNGGSCSSLNLVGADCRAGLAVSNLRVGTDLSLQGLVAAGPVRIGGVVAGGAMSAQEMRLEEAAPFTAALTAATCNVQGSRFDALADLSLAADEVVADDATFAGRAVLRLRAATPAGHCRASLAAVDFHDRSIVMGDSRVSVSDLRHTRCDELRLAGIHLGECRFDGATGLDELALTSESFSRRGDGLLRRGRIELQEERDNREGRPGALDAGRLAQLYRSLRKGLEDSRDAPGAADFYLAELEMRRRVRDKPQSEALVLWAYRTFAGYGVRPLRPALWLALLLIAATASASALGAISETRIGTQTTTLPARTCAFASEGRPAKPVLRCAAVKSSTSPPASERNVDRDLVTAGVVVIRSTLGLSRAADERLRAGGQLLIALTRLLGATLLAFVALGLRSMVRR